MFVPDKNTTDNAANAASTQLKEGAADAINMGKQAIEAQIDKQVAKAGKVVEKGKEIVQKAQQAGAAIQGAAGILGATPSFHSTPGFNGKLPTDGEFTPLSDIDIPDTNASMIAADILGVVHSVSIQIVIGGAIYTHFHSFQLQQSSSQHHSFQLVLAHDAMDTSQDHTIEEARDFLGQTILVTFKYKNILQGGPERDFKGIITQVGFAQEHGSLGNIVLTGKSPTALLDAAPHTQSFGGETSISLQSLAQEVIEQGVNEQQMKVAVKCAFKGNLQYTCQYNETHYNYLARMAAAYGEWFYYDGDTLHFGKPPLPNPITLIYGKDTRQVQLKMTAAHVNHQHHGYNSKTHQLLSGGQTELKGLGELGTHAYNASKKLFKTKSLQVSPIRAVSDQDVEVTQKGRTGSAAANMFTLTGNTSVPFLYPGCLIEMNFRQPQSSDIKYFSRMLVTQVSHHVEAKGNYHCNFEAIPSDTEHIPQPSYVMPIAQPQIATVTDNKDSQGRVKVKFDWQANGDTTDFIRVMSPDAGSSEKVSKNRGLVTIPEIKDQVMVGFQLNHPDRPYVMGGLFHGKIGSGGGGGNNVKSLSSKSGHCIKLNDGGGITVTDKAGNVVAVDGAGNITATSSATNAIDVGEGKAKMKMDSGGNITIEANAKIELKVGGSTLTITSDTIALKTTNNTITGNNNTITGKNHITGGTTTIDGGDVFIN